MLVPVPEAHPTSQHLALHTTSAAAPTVSVFRLQDTLAATGWSVAGLQRTWFEVPITLPKTSGVMLKIALWQREASSGVYHRQQGRFRFFGNKFPSCQRRSLVKLDDGTRRAAIL